MRRKRAEPVTFVRSPIRTKPVSGPISNVSRPLNLVCANVGTNWGSRLEPAHGVGDRARVLRGRAAARAGDVEQPVLGELAQQRRRHVRRLVVAAERVRQAGVRVARREAGRDAREIGDVRPHLLRAERAVDADDQRLGVLDRRPERLDRLPGQRAAGEVDDRDADPERQLRRDLARGDDRGLAVERVEDRLDQQQVDAAVGEAADLLGVRLDDLRRRCACGSPGRRRAG